MGEGLNSFNVVDFFFWFWSSDAPQKPLVTLPVGQNTTLLQILGNAEKVH